jgi:hypothetical protein
MRTRSSVSSLPREPPHANRPKNRKLASRQFSPGGGVILLDKLVSARIQAGGTAARGGGRSRTRTWEPRAWSWPGPRTRSPSRARRHASSFPSAEQKRPPSWPAPSKPCEPPSRMSFVLTLPVLHLTDCYRATRARFEELAAVPHLLRLALPESIEAAPPQAVAPRAELAELVDGDGRGAFVGHERPPAAAIPRRNQMRPWRTRRGQPSISFRTITNNVSTRRILSRRSPSTRRNSAAASASASLTRARIFFSRVAGVRPAMAFQHRLLSILP